MKIAVSSIGNNLNEPVAENFGRCPYFFLVEIEKGKIKTAKAIKNSHLGQTSGAGITAAQKVTQEKVTAVITGAIGPRALAVLRQFNIQVYKASGPIKTAIGQFIEAKLQKA